MHSRLHDGPQVVCGALASCRGPRPARPRPGVRACVSVLGERPVARRGKAHKRCQGRRHHRLQRQEEQLRYNSVTKNFVSAKPSVWWLSRRVFCIESVSRATPLALGACSENGD